MKLSYCIFGIRGLILFCVVMLMVLLAGTSSAQIKDEADVIPVITINPKFTAPQMNGRLDAYNHIGGGWIDFKSQNLRDNVGRYALSTTSDALYLATEVNDPRGKSVRTARDSEIYLEPSVEFYIVSEASSLDGYHFIFNPLGAIYDASLSQSREDSVWQCAGLQIANRFINGRWICEVRIPWESLNGIVAAKGFRLGLFYNENMSGSEGSSGITAGDAAGGTYLAPEKFIRVRLNSRVPSLRVSPDSANLVDNLKLSIPVTVQNADVKTSVRIWASLLPDAKNIDDAIRNGYEKKLMSAEEILASANQSWAVSQNAVPEAGAVYLRVSADGTTIYQSLIPYTKNKTDLIINTIYTAANKAFVTVGVQQPKLTPDMGSRVTLADSQGRALITKPLRGDQRQQMIELPLGNIPAGSYILAAEIFKTADSQPIVRKQEEYIKYDHPAWMNNTIGYTNGTVPSPWTPLQFPAERAVNLWGREYQFNAGGLPDLIKSQQQALLNKPISLVITDASGKKSILKGGNFEWKSRAGDVATFESRLTGPDILVAIKGRVEFDGFLWYEMNCIPLNGKKLPTANLELSCDAARTTLVNSNHTYSQNTGRIPERGWSKNLLGSPIFWFGNEDVGIQWFADDLRGWQLADYKNSAEIITDNGARLVRIHIFDDAETKKGESRQIAFGFQATPVRKLPDNWSNYRINGGWINDPINVANRTNLRFFLDHNTTLFSNMIPAPDAQEQLQKALKKGVFDLPYFAFLCTSCFSPEVLYYGEEWRSPVIGRRNLADKRWGFYDYMCPNSPSYRDYVVGTMANYVDAVHPGGLYFDFVQPSIYQCTNPAHGCLWKDNKGSARGSMRLIGSRELAKRIYVMLKQKDPNGLVVHHNSGGMIIPVSSFCDITLTGEEMTQDVFRQQNYYRLLPLDVFRANCMPSQWGVATCFLPEFIRALDIWDPSRVKGWYAKKENITALWHLMGLSLIHNSVIHGDSGIGRTMDVVMPLKKRLGWDDSVVFYPYWKPASSPFIKQSPSDDNVVVSGYQTSRGILLVPMNNTDQDTEMVIQIKPNPLGQDFVFTDERTREKLQTEKGILRVAVPARQPRLLVWEMKR